MRESNRPTVRTTVKAAVILPVVLVLCCVPVLAQLDKVEIETTPLRGGIYMLMGAGGNLGLSVGDDGIFLIDDQYAHP